MSWGLSRGLTIYTAEDPSSLYLAFTTNGLLLIFMDLMRKAGINIFPGHKPYAKKLEKALSSSLLPFICKELPNTGAAKERCLL